MIEVSELRDSFHAVSISNSIRDGSKPSQRPKNTKKILRKTIRLCKICSKVTKRKCQLCLNCTRVGQNEAKKLSIFLEKTNIQNDNKCIVCYDGIVELHNLCKLCTLVGRKKMELIFKNTNFNQERHRCICGIISPRVLCKFCRISAIKLYAAQEQMYCRDLNKIGNT